VDSLSCQYCMCEFPNGKEQALLTPGERAILIMINGLPRPPAPLCLWMPSSSVALLTAAGAAQYITFHSARLKRKCTEGHGCASQPHCFLSSASSPFLPPCIPTSNIQHPIPFITLSLVTLSPSSLLSTPLFSPSLPTSNIRLLHFSLSLRLSPPSPKTLKPNTNRVIPNQEPLFRC